MVKLLMVLGHDDTSSTKVRDRGAPGLLVEPASEHEIKVLRFLASGTPNWEIAAK
jgi:DNA-binding NarL/FixJ family response regulator